MSAAKSRSRAPSGPPAPHPFLVGTALVLLRVLPGAIFLDACHHKFVASGLSVGEVFDAFWRYDYRPLLLAAIEEPPRLFGWSFRPWSTFLDAVLLGSETWERLVSGAILVFEALLGASLVLGACTRAMAVLGALLVAAFGLTKATWLFTVGQTNWTLFVMLLAVAFLAAGRTWGLDARLARRLPSWIS